MLITVITPSFNSAKHISRCIRSIRDQTFGDVEHLVIDGGSSDGTVDLLRAEGVQFISEPDAGIYHALNKGISAAKGDVIHILNADDVYASSGVLDQVAHFFRDDSLELLYGRVLLNRATNIVAAERPQLFGRSATVEQLRRRMCVAHPSCFLRSTVYRRYGTFSPAFRIAGDYEFLLRIWACLSKIYLDEVFVEMDAAGVSNSKPFLSLLESMSAQLLSGVALPSALLHLALNSIRHSMAQAVRGLKVV